MELELASPTAAAVAALVALPLAALAYVALRAREVRRFLGVEHPGRAPVAAAAVAIVAVAALLGAAAAQPVIGSERPARARADTEVLVVVDTSRSMLARPSRSEPSRLDRARAAALALRREIPAVPVGIASLTDRLLPHAFPTADAGVFRHTLERSVGVGKPPPAEFEGRATTYYPLVNVVRGNLLRADAQRRVLVVLTDGEARDTDVGEIRAALARAEPLELLFVRFWGEDELVYAPDGSLETYRADPASGRALGSFARELDGEVYGEDELRSAAEALRDGVGDGPLVEAGRGGRPFALAPYLVAAAFVPLLGLLLTRNRA